MGFLADSTWVATIWLTLAIVLMIAEVLGAAGFLIGAAVAALAMAALTYFVGGLGIATQILIYAVVAVAATVIYFKFFRSTEPSNRATLPNRAASMVGRRFEIDEALDAGGEIRVQLGDTLWVVTSMVDIAAGTEVEVVDFDAMRLQVESRH